MVVLAETEMDETELRQKAMADMQVYLNALEKRISDWFDLKPVCCLSECFRYAKNNTAFKLSFHLVIPNLIFAPRRLSTDKRMLVLFQGLPNADVLGFDPAVYTANRQMRMVGHCKASDPHAPLKMIWKHCILPGHDTLPLITTPPPENVCVVRVQPNDFPLLENALKDYHAVHGMPNIVQVDASPRHKRQRTDMQSILNLADWLLPRVQRLLRLCGDRTTRVRRHQPLHDRGTLCFECNNESRRRICLLHPARNVEHESNHCRLFVANDAGLSAFAVEYTCMSKRCPTKPRVAVLGTIDRATGALKPSLLPAPSYATDATDEDNATDEDEQCQDDPAPDGAQHLSAVHAVRIEFARELMLAAAPPVIQEEVLALCKFFDPHGDDETRSLFLEWASRHPSFHTQVSF
jgi:hypothetical protein